MALQGTLETFSVPEVLRLLANTRKTGLLALDGDRGTGNVWLHDGSIVAAQSDNEGSGDIDATLFDLLRFGAGDFVFEAGAVPDEPGVEEIDVEAALGRAESLLTEWHDLETVVPSLRVGVRLVQELAGDSVMITSEQWRSLAAVGSGTSAAGLGQRLELGELDTCRRIRDLVDASLVEISDDAPEAESAPLVEREPVSAPRVNGRDGDLVDHDLSSEEVASLGDNLAGFVAKPSEERFADAGDDIDDSFADTEERDHERVEESAVETPVDGPAGADDVHAVSDPARSVAQRLDDVANGSTPADGDADEFLAQLTNLSPKAAAAIEATAEEAAGREPTTQEPDDTPPAAAEATPAPEGDEEINRNLLLKFLSSTKN
ncbi:MAG: DUF4388 domain-containing protein [Acidimicrobiales bacterium]|nr:DUF4388 domain-containing protein [Acidimicrobiales bacterium]